jgi:hypothetical protein
MAQRVRQAVVIIHGMGEHRPLDTLNGFIGAALDPLGNPTGDFFSRPDGVTDSYESRRYLARTRFVSGEEKRAQTEFFEYHWAYKMQGNRLEDLWPTFRRFVFLLPWFVPAGLRVVWSIFWALVIVAAIAVVNLVSAGFDFTTLTIDTVVRAVLGGGLVAIVVSLLLTYILTRFMPRWVTSSFVDVARYLDTSPRSYEVRREIRAGTVALLQGLHDATIRGKPRYQRIIVVGHSLGTFIGYDAITYLWGQMNELHRPPMDVDDKATGADGGSEPAGLAELEKAAAAVGPNGEGLDAYRDAQREAWKGLRLEGNPWRITDFLTFGSPMHFANRLMTLNPTQFKQRIDRRDFPTCPPQPDEGAKAEPGRWRLSYNNGGRRVLYHAAPFGIVRWTNLWFPPHLWFFGDWFSGPLAPMFGDGIKDTPLRGNRPASLVPALAHALYFSFPDDTSANSSTTLLREHLDLASSSWVTPTLNAPAPDPTSRGAFKTPP